MYSIVSIQEDHSTCLRPSLTLLLPWLVSLPPEWKRNALWCWSCNDKVLTLPRQCQSESKRCWTQYNLKLSLSETQTFISEIPWNGILPNSNYGRFIWEIQESRPEGETQRSVLTSNNKVFTLEFGKGTMSICKKAWKASMCLWSTKKVVARGTNWAVLSWSRLWSVTGFVPAAMFNAGVLTWCIMKWYNHTKFNLSPLMDLCSTRSE
jgi:hypothetical protein